MNGLRISLVFALVLASALAMSHIAHAAAATERQERLSGLQGSFLRRYVLPFCVYDPL